GVVPGIRVAAPRDEPTLREELREAVAVDDGPTVLRYPKGSVGPDLPAVRRIGGVDVLREPSGPHGAGPNGAELNGAELSGAERSGAGLSGAELSGAELSGADVLMVCVGSFGELGLAAAGRLADQGVGVTVVDPRWVFPVPPAIVDLARRHRLVVTVEDGGGHGG